ncbi:MAG: T9SS type A sorting domain-containing protein [Chitinophagales bacterium]|nr:T9SS type A sorting domain-containing protein [Chitinophagales bacterium]
MIFSSICHIDTAYMISGMAVDATLPYANAMLLNMDKTGVVKAIKENSTGLEYGIFLNNLIVTNQEGLAFTGYVIDTVPTLILARFSPITDSLVILRYTTPNTYVYLGNALIQADDNHFYIAGIKTDNQPVNGNVCLVKIDTAGNRIWEKFYNEYKLDDARSIIQLSNGNLLIGAFRSDNNFQTQQHANTWLLEVDTGGNIVRQWFDPNDSTYVAEGLRQTQDGGVIYGAQKKKQQSVNDVYKSSTIVKLDSNFNKQWMYDSDTLSPTGFTDIEILPDGSYIACGTKNYRYAWIVKLSATGQKLWSREYVGIPDWGSQNFLTDIDVLPDGSLIAVGQCQLSGATPPQVGWFLKLDSNGCEIENCLVGIEEPAPLSVGEGSGVRLFPNPTSSSVTVSLEYEMLNAVLKVYDVTGKAVKEFQVSSLPAGHAGLQFTIDISDLSKGLYVITAEKQGKFARAKLVVE